MLEDHNIPQLVGICGIVISYLFAIVFNALNGIGGKLLLPDIKSIPKSYPYFVHLNPLKINK